MNKSLLLAYSFSFLCIWGCASTIEETPQQIIREQISVLYKEPDLPYENLGTYARSDNDLEDIIESLQDLAIEKGGNAILVVKEISNDKGGVNAWSGAPEQRINLLVNIIRLKD